MYVFRNCLLFKVPSNLSLTQLEKMFSNFKLSLGRTDVISRVERLTTETFIPGDISNPTAPLITIPWIFPDPGDILNLEPW